jgi:hypothetical protein
MNWYKNHTLYEFVLYNSYKKLYEFVIQFVLYKFVLVNLYTKISEKKICIRVGISTPDQYLRLKSSNVSWAHWVPGNRARC